MAPKAVPAQGEIVSQLVAHTLSGPHLFLGRPLAHAANLGAVDRPDFLRHVADLAAARLTNGSLP